MKKYTFYYHYNKPASLKFKKPKLSVHFKNTCYIVDNLKCNVPARSFHRKIQPRCVIKGMATSVTISNSKELGDFITID